MKIYDIINITHIQLENVKVSFATKLLQYNINNLLFKYSRKYAFKENVDALIGKITDVIKNSEQYKENHPEATELFDKARNVVSQLKSTTIKFDKVQAVDATLRYILFNFNKNKTTLTIFDEIEILDELKLIKKIIQDNNIQHTDRIKNCFKLYEQLKNSIITKL